MKTIIRLIWLIILSILYVTLIELTPKQVPFDGALDLVELFPVLGDYYLKINYLLLPIYGIVYGYVLLPHLFGLRNKAENKELTDLINQAKKDAYEEGKREQQVFHLRSVAAETARQEKKEKGGLPRVIRQQRHNDAAVEVGEAAPPPPVNNTPH
jgi:hypothetical protein